jgi:ppGpp synthetase/RelA/SpoT-type nucleotidyltranferase
VDLIDDRASELQSWYSGHIFKCRMFEERIRTHLDKKLSRAGVGYFKIETRTKSVESFVKKAAQVTVDGHFKYTDPRVEVKDFVGARVEVPLSTDLPAVVAAINAAYVIEEELDRGSEDGALDVPGYRSLHFLAHVTEEDRLEPELRDFADMTVEIQVRTTLQHAWASLQHDLVYKTERQPTSSIKRRLVALAGLLELADREFVSIRQAHSEMGDSAPVNLEGQTGALSASGLRHLAEQIFGEEDSSSHAWFVQLKKNTDLLSLTSAADLRDALGDWWGRAPQVAAAVRRTKPWANLGYLLDLLLRLAMRHRYLELIPPDDVDEVGVEEFAALVRGFHDELESVDAALTMA